MYVTEDQVRTKLSHKFTAGMFQGLAETYSRECMKTLHKIAEVFELNGQHHLIF
jgi:hypothetical protein